jgi:hypothetical protein
MMRIITWRANGTAPADTTPGAAVAAFNELSAAVDKISGAGDSRWGFGNGGIVTVSNYDSYGVNDDLLKDPAIQASVLKIFALGLGIAEDHFIASADQIMPFLPQQ